MNRTCMNCGAETAAEARFCRQCGAPLRVTSGVGEGSETVSPRAATIPLSEDVRTTDGLPFDDPRRAGGQTSRVSPNELDTMLNPEQRQPQQTPPQQGQQPSRELPPQGEQQKPFDPYATVYEADGGGDGARSAATTGELVERGSASSPLPRAPGPEEDFDLTRPAQGGEFDEEMTIMASRPQSRPFDSGQTPSRVQPTPARGAPSAGHASAQGSGAPSQSAAAQAAAVAPRRRSMWPVVIGVVALLLVMAAAGAWLAVRFLNNRGQTAAGEVPATAPSADARSLAQERLTEAESLLAAGDLSGAVERLREAVRLDPTNARAHRRLGDVLLDTGDRRGGIEELRAATQYEPNDFTTWRALAAAQLAEGLPADAVESYRRLLALTPDADPNDQLSFADSLRLAGRADEARAVYQTLSASASPEVASAARERLAELGSALPSPTPQPTREVRPGEDPTQVASQANANTGTASTQPTPAPAPTIAATPPPRPADASPAERYQRGRELWGANRGAAVTEFLAAARGGITDANYYLGLNLVEGKNMGTLKRAEIVAALGYFQRAQSGSHAAESRRYVQQLEREFDRIRQQ